MIQYFLLVLLSLLGLVTLIWSRLTFCLKIYQPVSDIFTIKSDNVNISDISTIKYQNMAESD